MGENAVNKPDDRRKLVIAVVVLFFVLLFPGHPQEFTLNALWQLPVEWPLLILFLLLTPRSMRKGICALFAILALVLMLLRLADIGSYLAFNRRFNPILELHLLKDGWNLASTSTGPVQALVITCLALLALVAIVWFLYRCMLRIAAVSQRLRRRTLAIAVVATMLIAAGLVAEQQFDYNSPVQANIVPEFNKRVKRLTDSIADQRAFIVELDSDSVLDTGQPQFKALAGKDVIVVFVESYGRGYVDAERFSAKARQRLTSVQSTLEKNSVLSKSGWLSSPIRGGRSWLAHSSFQSGLKIDNQARFDRLVTTQRSSLSSLFETAGWETIGIMPAIQFAWPEGNWYEFSKLFVAENMQYQGERFGFATMPDQYTMSHFQRSIREPSVKPVMATIALLSTHAPWTPLPEKLDWSSIGDGSVYDGSRRFGERISWKYRSKVQDMYARSFDYTLDILGEYAALYADDAVIIIMGDHQPAPIINGWGKSGDVPVHVLSKDASILQRLPDQFWSDGMIPSATTESQPMWEMRKRLSTIFE